MHHSSFKKDSATNLRIARPLLHYTFVPRTLSKKHHHQSVMRCFMICLGFCTCIVLLCMPAYHQMPHRARIENGVVAGWSYNTSRKVLDYVQPDNITTIIHPDLCNEVTNKPAAGLAKKDPIFVLIIVCSAVSNFERRNAIRNTWASTYNNSTYLVRIGFLLGLLENNTLQDKIEEESRIHKDIIQEQFIDSYNNLTLKSVMMLKWVQSNCVPGIQFLMKTDDDVYVNIPNLVKLLLKMPNSVNLLLGYLFCHVKPIADIYSKWYSPKYMYSGKFYPNYLSGTGYIMSADVVTKLYIVSLRTPLFHLEDVYITGICSREAQVQPHGHSEFYFMDLPMDPCLHKNQVTTHHISPESMVRMYRILKNSNASREKCKHNAIPTKSEVVRYSQRGRLIIGKKVKHHSICA